MLHLLALAALALSPAPAVEDCEACRRGKVCAPHKANDKAELRRLAPLLDSEDVDQRMGELFFKYPFIIFYLNFYVTRN